MKHYLLVFAIFLVIMIKCQDPCSGKEEGACSTDSKCKWVAKTGGSCSNKYFEKCENIMDESECESTGFVVCMWIDEECSPEESCEFFFDETECNIHLSCVWKSEGDCQTKEVEGGGETEGNGNEQEQGDEQKTGDELKNEDEQKNEDEEKNEDEQKNGDAQKTSKDQEEEEEIGTFINYTFFFYFIFILF